MAHWPWKKSLDFGGNSDHVTLGLGLGVMIGLWLRLAGGRMILRNTGIVDGSESYPVTLGVLPAACFLTRALACNSSLP